MSIQCHCEACGARFRVDEKFAGRKARCPKCSAVLQVPSATEPAAAAPVSPPAVHPRPAAAKPAATARPAPQAVDPGPAPAAVPNAVTDIVPHEPAGPIVVTKPAASPSPGGSGIHSSAPAKRHKKKTPVLLLALGGGGIALAAAALLVVFAMQAPTSSPAPARRPTTPGLSPLAQATLKLDWPVGDRAGGSLMIDKESKPISATGDLKFNLPPGPHKLLIRRRGFEPIELAVELKVGKIESVKPDFVAAKVTGTPVASVPAKSNEAEGAFPIGSAVGPRGFNGWLQNFEVAQRKATTDGKDLLVVFACTDADAETQELVRTVLSKDEFKTKTPNFVSVVVDFPQTVEGYELVENRDQNERLRRDFLIREVPTVALVDQAGRPYFIKRHWEDGFQELLTKLPEWQQSKTKRDEIFTKAKSGDEAERLAAAEQALDWLFEQRLGPLYQPEVKQWKTLADKLDAQNAQGKLEKFFEFEWFVRAADVRRDQSRMQQAAQEVKSFTDDRKFVDPDRAARLFLAAAALFIRAEKTDDAVKLLERSAAYEPKDRELRQNLQAATRALKSRNQFSSGTGFVISESGYLLTNHHVVDGKGALKIRLPGQDQPAAATIVAQDELLDIALVKFDMPAEMKLKAIPLSTGKVGRGASVAAFGYPLGDTLGSGVKFAEGRVSALPDPTADNMLLLDLRVNPGNSGGPLCDSRGNVVGMITAKTSALLDDSYGLARPVSDLVKFLESHLPADAKRPEPFADEKPLEWDAVDARVGDSVLMLVKVKE